MRKRLLKIEEVAISVGVSVKTINNWYRFKKENPDNEQAKMLPPFQQEHDRAPRYWHTEDIFKLIEFKQKLPSGRGGIMGSVTQRYNRKEK